MIKTDTTQTTDTTNEEEFSAPDQYFRVTDQVPTEVWYGAAVVSVIASALLFMVGKRDWGIFVGQWPPTFLLFGVFHKLIRPSSYYY